MTTQELSRLVLEKDKSGLPLDRKVKLCVVRNALYVPSQVPRPSELGNLTSLSLLLCAYYTKRRH